MMQNDARTADGTERPPGIGRWALAGAAVGLLVGLLLCLLDVPAVLLAARESGGSRDGWEAGR
jgi:hypothetical protein